jgi:hypothetical protein
MSEIKVNKISPRSGTDITLGDSGDNFIIPSGATLTNNGTASGFASIAWQSTIVTGTTLSAVAGNGYWIDTTSNACTVTLPASANVGDQIIFSDYARTWNTNNLTINTNSLNYQGNTSPNPVYDTNGETVSIVYSGATQGWIPVDDGAVALETPQGYSAEYLVVAGGGGSGYGDAGGGGAGGYLTNYGTSTIFLTTASTYTITVGAGGAGSSTPGADGSKGSDSVLSGYGISTVTSFGGGAGANGDFSPSSNGDGGSGGGAGHLQPSGATGGNGTVGQGNDGGDGTGNSAPQYGGGGGGGAGAAGANGSGSSGGNGGDGLSNSITGSAVYYAGGGGGGADSVYGTGGQGGGGNAGAPGTNGTANTGGGAGGQRASGGSGVVILRVATANYSGTTTGSPTVTTDGTDTIIKFTSSGSYTA